MTLFNFLNNLTDEIHYELLKINIIQQGKILYFCVNELFKKIAIINSYIVRELLNMWYLTPLFLFTVLHLSVLPTYSQSDNKQLRENFLYGEYYLSKHKYREALPFYLSIYQNDSLNANINYRIGQCYINIRGEKLKSIPYLEKASRNITSKYISGKYDTDAASIEALLLLGEAYQRGNHLNKALQKYLDYKDQLTPKDKQNLKKADLKIQSIDVAKQELDKPADLKLTSLGSNINSRFSDYNPVVPDDESILIFTSFWESADLIFQSINNNGEWTEPIDITQELGSEGDCYTGAISRDGKELYIIKQGNYNSDIYVSYYNGNKWSTARKLNKKVNSNEQETSITISSDGNVIYFSSNRAGGEGGFDIYKSEKKDGEWDKPVNLGASVNSQYNEEAPYILDNILLFSSEGHRNMGGMDIFYSTLTDDNTWSEPINIGSPINTTNDDLFIIHNDNREISYFSKFDPNGYGKHDIFKLEARLEEVLKKNIIENHNEVIAGIAGQDTITEDRIELASINMDNKTDTDTYLNTDAVTDNYNYAQQHNSDTLESNTIFNNKEPINEEIPYYTVQIMALRKPVNPSYFKNLDKVKIYKGDDLLNRYTYGKYLGYTLARKYLEKACKLGYKDAFIRDIKSVSNYNEYHFNE